MIANVKSRPAVLALLFLTLATSAFAQANAEAAKKRRFTVADDIGMAQFGDGYLLRADPVTFSPDGKHFIVDTERGLLEQNRSETTLRIFRTEDVHQFLLHPGLTDVPSPVWMFSKSTYKDASVISRIRWLRNSNGFAFLARTTSGNDQVFLADLRTKTVDPLTPDNQDVTGFDIRDRGHFVYSALSPMIEQKALAESQAPSIVGTGRTLSSLLFPGFRRKGPYYLWQKLDYYGKKNRKLIFDCRKLSIYSTLFINFLVGRRTAMPGVEVQDFSLGVRHHLRLQRVALL